MTKYEKQLKILRETVAIQIAEWHANKQMDVYHPLYNGKIKSRIVDIIEEVWREARLDETLYDDQAALNYIIGACLRYFVRFGELYAVDQICVHLLDHDIYGAQSLAMLQLEMVYKDQPLNIPAVK